MTQPSDLKGQPLSLTETRNPRTTFIDRASTAEIVRLFLEADKSVASAVEAIAAELTRAVDLLFEAIKEGGRLIYLGAGTSGRLGILDASELPPTFGVAPELAVALIAGGRKAVTQAVEGAEDNQIAAEEDLSAASLKPPDILLGISASGLTPYVRSGLAFARESRCKTILLTCNPRGPFPPVDVLLNPIVGPEVITGSTRLKSGTACKMVLNLLSSSAMIRFGKVYQNLMVDLRATNAKLQDRAIRIVAEAGNVPRESAETLLKQANGETKVAIFLARRGGAVEKARETIASNHGILFRALREPVSPIPAAIPQASNPESETRLSKAIEASLTYLQSEAASSSLAKDAYWPKWNSPWWHITLLFEMGAVKQIPEKSIQLLLETVCKQYLDRFPFRIEDVPPGIDPVRDIFCHCALGTLYQIFFAWGLDVDRELPFARDWFLRYQLPDGGLNCDEAAYTRPEPKSSIVSTLPPMEAILNCTPRPFTSEELTFLDRGAEYLLNHRLFRSARNPDRIIDETWTKLCFPRFYNYDLLRGMTFLRSWANIRGASLPREAVGEAEEMLRFQIDPATGIPIIGDSWHPKACTTGADPKGDWKLKFPSSTFPLLELVRQPRQLAPWLKPSADLVLG